MTVSTLDAEDPRVESAARQGRVDLAAAHRLAVREGFNEGIFNQVQLYAMWTGQPLNPLPQETIEHTIEWFKKAPRYAGKSAAEHHFDALKRGLNRDEPGYSS